MNDRERLHSLLVARSVQTGKFTLASGRTSNFYIDARLTTMSPEGMVLIGKLGLEEIRSNGWNADSVGGLTLGADPVSYAIAHVSATENPPLRAFTVRKEAKTHGTGRRIEGPFRRNDQVVVIEDVITTGNSALEAIRAIEQEGGRIVGVLAVVDREEGGRRAITDAGYTVSCLATKADLMASTVSSDSDDA
jgi:orotate phosphoribosyltransferase